MKRTTKEEQIQHRMEPGVISSDGFLGDDLRHYTDIIREDEITLERLGYTPDQVADRMQELTAEAYKSPDGPTDFGKLILDYFSYRGKVICPFTDPGVFSKAVIWVTNTENKIQIRWTPLHIHLIRHHHFFEGKGASFRIEPELLIKCLF
jgi:hypothetical protein